MAAHGWGKDTGVSDWLEAEPYGFDFFQAVRLIELAERARLPEGAAEPPSVGEGAEPAREPVRFRSGVGFDFPASDVAEVRRPEGEGDPWRMTVNFMGLAGASGPLDTPATELIIEREWKGDEAPRAFLDIFNHRLVSLFYLTRKLHRVGLDTREPGRDRVAAHLYAVAGLGTKGLRDRMQVNDRALLFYAGLLGQQPRSMAGLEAIVSHYFGVGAKGTPFKGRWQPLEEKTWTRIGETGQNARLGVDATVGTRYWDEQGAFELELGPLTLEQFEGFLPTGWAFRPLCDLVRFYVGDELDFSFRLRLAAGQAPVAWLPQRRDPEDPSRTRWGQGGARVAREGGARLGWTARLGASWDKTDARASVSPASFKANEVAPGVPHFGLPPGLLRELADGLRRVRVRAGTVVYRQGKRGASMYVVREGGVKLVRREEDGGETTIRTCGPGDCFGERAMLTGKFRPATAVALEECVLLKLSKRDLRRLALKYPHFRPKSTAGE